MNNRIDFVRHPFRRGQQVAERTQLAKHIRKVRNGTRIRKRWQCFDIEGMCSDCDANRISAEIRRGARMDGYTFRAMAV